MSKISSKITVPIVLVGLFSIVIFVSLNYEQLGLTFYVVLLFLSVYIFSFGFAVGQNFSSPIKKLLEKATELSKGNLSSRVYLHTKDELSELANIINKIAEELEESHIDSKIIEKTADVKAKARTQVLEESVNALEQKVRSRTTELERILGESRILQRHIKEKETEITRLKKEITKLNSKIKKNKPNKRV